MDNDSTSSVDPQDRDALLRERGYEPSELTESEQNDILGDVADTDTDNDRLSNIIPQGERDDTETM